MNERTHASPAAEVEALEIELEERFELRCPHPIVTSLRQERRPVRFCCSECGTPLVRRGAS